MSKLLRRSLSIGLFVAALVILTAADPLKRDRANAATVCDASTISALETARAPMTIDCSLTLAPDAVVLAPIVLAGSSASQTVIDCNGGTLKSVATDQVALTITSIRRGDGRWDVPRDIAVRHCIIEGAVRVIGMGANGEAEPVRQSSLFPGHTQRAQAAAPSNIMLSDLTITTKAAIPLYVGPGTTKLSVTGSRFRGESGSVGIYLDAESADNTIEGNHFDLVTKSREIIAVDGSAHNVITGNRFDSPAHGGIFLYRNCGEGGTIRHQPPQHNVISGNLFVYRDHGWASSWTTKPAIWLGSRQGERSYCFQDRGRPFGSSLSSRDDAQYNLVRDNGFEGGSLSLIVNNDADNQVIGNR